MDKISPSTVKTDTTDFIIDMDSIAKQQGYAGQFSNDLILDPLNGGRWIEEEALEVGDLILYKAANFLSKRNTSETKKTVSLSAVYIGSGKVIKLIESKITETDLASLTEQNEIAAVLRHQLITPAKAGILRDALIKKSRHSESSNRLVEINNLRIQILPVVCSSLSPAAKAKCNSFTGRIQLGTTSNDKYFIDNNILEAYKQADMAMSNTNPKWTVLDEIITVQYNGSLRYAGHFKSKGEQSKSSKN